MELLADRFLQDGDRLIDLATGRHVVVHRLPLGSSAEQRAWADRCAAELGTSGRASELVEFGYLGRAARFEAYRCERGAAENEPPAPPSPEAAPPSQPTWAAAVDQMIELLDAGRPGRWRDVTVRLADQRSAEAFVQVLAHRARRCGYVPLLRGLLDRYRDLVNLLAERHVLLIDPGWDESSRASGGAAARWLDLAMRNARPNVVLRLRLDPQHAGVGVEPTLQMGDDREGRRLAEAAPRYVVVAPPLEAAEAAVPYGSAPSASASTGRHLFGARGAAAPGLALPADHVLARMRRGIDLVRRGLHAPGERALRQALAALWRRERFEAAGEAALALGGLLRERGRSREALGVFDRARAAFPRAGALARAAEAAAGVGAGRVDLGQLCEAEAALRGALGAAREAGAARVEQVARLALVRCLVWQADLDEAEAVLGSSPGADPVLAAAALRARARLALLRDDLLTVGRAASEALAAAREAGDPRGVATSHALIATLQGRIGHADAVADQVRRGLLAARAAHAPLVALALRLAGVEGLRAAGRLHEARRLAQRLARYGVERLPALLAARTRLVLAPFLPDRLREHAERSVEGFVRASGARALAIARQEGIAMDLVQDVIEVLRICQEAADEERALAALCTAVRERTGAAAVVVRAADPPDLTLAAVGACRPPRLDALERTLASGLLIPPGRYGDGVEAAAPMRYAGRTIGALGCRWPADAVVRASTVAGLLAAAATAGAPAVRALLDRRASTAAAAPADGDHLGLLGASAAIAVIRRQVERAAAAAFPVLIEGESGSGKELVARAIHRLSARRDRRFAAVNCAALPDDLLEAELFGHARGAFTGAVGDRAGLFEEADRGVLFLDEVSELSARAQAKVLRALQEGEVRRVGENTVRRVDVRVVAATNRPLAREIETGRFRQDLYYRLAVIPIAIPPLRDRPEDVPVLAAHFWAQAAAQVGSRATLAPETLAALARYEWPGNVRELQNAIALLALNAPARGRVTPEALPAAIAASTRVSAATLDEARRAFERRFVRAALARSGGRRAQAAAELGLTRQGLAKLLRRLGLEAEGSTAARLE